MNCRDVLALLPEYALETLSSQELARLEQHLSSGCNHCQQELEELRTAASLLAETTRPVVPSATVKQALFERIDAEQRTGDLTEDMSSAGDVRMTQPSWLTYAPYLAATLAAVLVGSWGARVIHAPADRPVSPATVAQQEAIRGWRRKIAAAEEAFGPPRIQLAGLEAGSQQTGIRAAIFCDGLAEELHILVANTVAPKGGQQLWFWLVDAQGNRLAKGPLEYVGQGHAAGIFSLSTPLTETTTTAAEVLVTDELQGAHDTPEGPVVGQARVSTDK